MSAIKTSLVFCRRFRCWRTSDSGAVRTPAECVANRELFFVDPVGSAVDDLFRAVGGQACDHACLEVLDVNVVEAHVRYFGSIGRELRKHQARRRTASAEFEESSRFAIEHPVVAAGILAPHALGIREDQKSTQI